MTEQDHSLFNEYFQIDHAIDVNVTNGGLLETCPDDITFEAMIPLPYKLASEMKGVEQTMLRPLRQLGDAIEPLADYLKAQSRKIDLMMSYILQSQDEECQKLKTVSYGGGGFIVEIEHSETNQEQPFTDNNWLICKLFFSDDAAAVFCLGKIIETTSLEDKLQYKIAFHKVRDEDREIIVRASLHQQSKQLLKKTQQREKEK